MIGVKVLNNLYYNTVGFNTVGFTGFIWNEKLHYVYLWVCFNIVAKVKILSLD